MTQTSQPAKRSPKLLLIVIAAVALVAVAGGVLWAVLAGRDAAQGAPGAVDAAGAPVERADGLPAETELGITELKVTNLDNVQAYYQNAVGLAVIDQQPDSVTLGLDGVSLMRLEQSAEPLPQVGDAGLYHTAILFADEASLAKAVLQTAQFAPGSYQGSADHLVSQAFYFGDPEGNGVELYVDRPRDEWKWKDGEVEMGSEPLDPNAFIEEHLDENAADTAVIGHIHLKVGDLEDARRFYADTLGFDVVSQSEGALFYSAGGYHHHIATNTWQSAGAGPRSTEVGLGALTIALPTAADVEKVAARVEAAGFEHEAIEHGIVVDDPWGNTIRLVVGASATQAASEVAH
ncbi:VOC family protein [Leucobacter sp. NPDC015123]|uniref:VOC family protein n=1 Tax=Leucobacter sp. NPDC015123 TaxID=3364129 RepID=UPI0036F450E5